MEIIVDDYNEDERAMGWYYYLEETLRFPFKARCIRKRHVSPLSVGEEVEAITTDKQTQQAVEDWHYWVGKGYQF